LNDLFTVNILSVIFGYNLNKDSFVDEQVKSRPVLMNAAFMIVVLAGAKAASTILIPFALAVFAAIVTHPLVRLFQRVRVPKPGAILITVTVVLAISTIIGQVVSASVKGFSTNLPMYTEQLKTQLLSIPALADFDILNVTTSSLIAQVDPGMSLKLGLNVLSGFGDVLGNVFLITLAVIFMLFEADLFASKLTKLANGSSHLHVNAGTFIESVKGYMMIKTLTSLATGVLIAFFLWWMDINHFLLWGLIAFLFNFIPNIGSIIAAIPAVCLAFVQFGSGTALLVMLLYVAINTLIGSVVEPRFMGEGLGLSTLVVFLSLVFWGWLLGPVGMLLSIPLTMVVKIACDMSPQTAWLSLMLSGVERFDRSQAPNDDAGEVAR
jgi:predicted PurR-regulated permease PerM